MTGPLPTGHRVVVHSFAESPDVAWASHMTLEPMEPPDVATLGPRDVLIRVASAAVGWVDLLMSSGQYQHTAQPPYTPGLESAGTVAWKGPQARADLHEGAAVLVDGLLAGPRSLGAYQRWGGFATYVVAPDHAVLPLPATISRDQAAGMLGAYETAYHALVARGRVQAGETVLIHGAAGATGLAAVEVAKLLGATVIATGRSPAKLQVVQDHGADHLIELATENGGLRPFRDEVKRLTAGRGVDVVYDPVGGDVSGESLRCVRFGARFLIVGWASTPAVAHGKGGRGAPNANHLPTNLMMMKGLDVLGCPTAIATAVDPRIRAPRLCQVMQWAVAGQIRPHVSHVFGLDEFREALRCKWQGEVVGGCVVRP